MRWRSLPAQAIFDEPFLRPIDKFLRNFLVENKYTKSEEFSGLAENGSD